MRERRRFYRFADSALVKYRVVQPDTMVQGVQALQRNGEARQHLEQVFLGIDARLFELTSTLERESPAVAEAVDLLNKKVGFLERLVLRSENDQDDGHDGLSPRQVSLSACGMALCSASSIAADAYLEIELVLLPGHRYIRAYAKVIECREQIDQTDPNERYRICVDFEYIRDDDREVLIQHIFKKQAAQLRSERNAAEIVEPERAAL